MDYETYTRAINILQRAASHIRSERGNGNCQDAIARNQTLRTLADAQRKIVWDTFEEHNS
jgi:hypothetical protein